MADTGAGSHTTVAEPAPLGPPAEPRRMVLAVCLAGWSLAVIVAVVRALSQSWYPLGDQALIAIRALDVATEHHPLLGTSSSAALGAGVFANHPGPLLFYLTAVPVKLLGPGAGLAIGTAAINLVAGALAIVFAERQRGALAASLATVVVAVLTASYGPLLVVDPYNPVVSMLPFFSVLVLGWGVLNGDRRAIVWLIACSTFCVQANLAYTIVVLPFVTGVAGWATWVHVRPRTTTLRGSYGRVLTAVRGAAAVGAVLWFPPIVEQLVHGGRGNMALLARAAGSTEAPLGVAEGTRRAAATMVLWPGWGPGTFGSYGFFEVGPHLATAVVGLLVAVVGLALLARFLRCHRVAATARLCGLASASTALGWGASSQVPLSPFFGFSADYVRWLWPMGAFAAMAVALGVCDAARVRFGGAPRVITRRSGWMLAVVAVAAFAVPALTTTSGSEQADAEFVDDARATVRDLVEQARRPLAADRFVWLQDSARYPALAYPVLAGLRNAGADFVVTDPIALRQFGPRRQADTDAAGQLPSVQVYVGWDAMVHRRQAVAFSTRLTSAEADELATMLTQFVDAFTAGAVRLSPYGREVAAGPFTTPWLDEVAATGGLDQETLFLNSETVVAAMEQGYFEFDDPLRAAVDRLVTLSRGVEYRVASVVVD